MTPSNRFFTEFQSHEPEFDYLKSLEIEEKINQIKWLKRRNVSALNLFPLVHAVSRAGTVSSHRRGPLLVARCNILS